MSAARRFVRNPQAVASAALLALIIGAVLLAPALTAHQPGAAELGRAFAGPEAGHPLGFDSAGRDVWSRLLH
ncbi:oligopeptide transport permease C-like protein, partial [Saccharothrix texasensis]